MARNRFVRWAGVTAVAGSVAALVRLARGGPTPVFETASTNPPSVVPGPEGARTADSRTSDPVTTEPRATQPRTVDPPPESAEPVDAVEPGGSLESVESVEFVESVDGGCPADRPIKGNTRSGIFHVPDGAMYDRTRADRCYATEEAARADGLRRAKH